MLGFGMRWDGTDWSLIFFEWDQSTYVFSWGDRFILIFCLDGGFLPSSTAMPSSPLEASARHQRCLYVSRQDEGRQCSKMRKSSPILWTRNVSDVRGILSLNHWPFRKLNTFKVKNALLHKNFYVAFLNRAPRRAAWLPTLIIRGRAAGPATASINH